MIDRKFINKHRDKSWRDLSSFIGNCLDSIAEGNLTNENIPADEGAYNELLRILEVKKTLEIQKNYKKHNYRLTIQPQGKTKNKKIISSPQFFDKLRREFNKINDENLETLELCRKVKGVVKFKSLFAKCSQNEFNRRAYNINQLVVQFLDMPKSTNLKHAVILGIIQELSLIESEKLGYKSKSEISINSIGKSLIIEKVKQEKQVLEVENEIAVITSEITEAIEKLRQKERNVFNGNQVIAGQEIIVNRLPWRILPEGEWLSNVLTGHYKNLSFKNKWQGKKFDENRLMKIESNLNPTHCYVGEKDFEGYVVYCFDWTDKVVLECPIYGNATYVISGNWQEIASVSKWIARYKHSKQVAAIHHSKLWFEKLKSSLRSPY